MTAGETRRAIEATFRLERARLIAGLARLVRTIDRAKELAQSIKRVRHLGLAHAISWADPMGRAGPMSPHGFLCAN